MNIMYPAPLYEINITVSIEALIKLCPVLICVRVPRAPTPPIWCVSVMSIPERASVLLPRYMYP